MSLRHVLGLSPVIPILAVDRARDIVPLACALRDGGLPVVEVPMLTSVATQAIQRIAAEVAGLHVVAGGGFHPADLRRVGAAVRLAVLPGFASFSGDPGVSLLPAVHTEAEVRRGVRLGFDTFRLCGRDASRTLSVLRSFAASAPSLAFSVAGSASPEAAGAFLQLPSVLSVTADWVVPDRARWRGDWAEIRRRAAAAAALSRHRPA